MEFKSFIKPGWGDEPEFLQDVLTNKLLHLILLDLFLLKYYLDSVVKMWLFFLIYLFYMLFFI